VQAPGAFEDLLQDNSMPESTTLADLTEIALKFRAERDWQQFHNPKDVALSMSLEVAELVEIMQWRNGGELDNHLKANRGHVGQELSDILGWVLLLAHDLRIDLPEAFREKMRENGLKYPVEKAKGIAKKYTEL
jgi:dCTP diphosphatase